MTTIPLDDTWLDLLERGTHSHLIRHDDGTYTFSEGFSLTQLLGFLSGRPIPPSVGDWDSYTLDVAAIADAPVVDDGAVCLSERDLIRALIGALREARTP